MNIALVYCLAALLAIVVAAPVALLAPVFFAASLPDFAGSVETAVRPIAGTSFEIVTTANGRTFLRRPTAEETIIEQGDNEAGTVPMADTCAPFVAVYLSRGESRPAVYAWSLCAATPAPAYYLSKAGKGLRGAPLASAKRKASRTLCVSHACPTVRL